MRTLNVISNSGIEKVDNFVNTLAPIVINEFLRRKTLNQKVISPTVVIAQAALESGWNLDADTLFGIKGGDLELVTTEYIDGQYITVTDCFAKYPTIAEAVQGYYNLMQWENYDDATSACYGIDEIEGLTNNVGLPYATSPDYKDSLINIINDFALDKYNDFVYGDVRTEDCELLEVRDSYVKIKLIDGSVRTYLA